MTQSGHCLFDSARLNVVTAVQASRWTDDDEAVLHQAETLDVKTSSYLT